jgi:hypothetical protein
MQITFFRRWKYSEQCHHPLSFLHNNDGKNCISSMELRSFIVLKENHNT